jgi:hypothetical protein
MDHLAAPLEALRGRALAWLLDRDARVLHVPADAELHPAARVLLLSLEWAPENRTPLFELRAGDWEGRGQELLALYAARAAACEGAGVRLPAVPGTPRAGATAVAAFGVDLAAVARALDCVELGTTGIAVLLGAGLPDDGRPLLAAPGLEQVRWILLDAATKPVPSSARSPDRKTWTVPCAIDRAAAERDTGERLSSLIAALESGDGSAPAGARPRCPPPSHPADPPTTSGDGPPPHLLPMLLGFKALRDADLPRAMAHFGQARDAAQAAGSTSEAVEMEILLASTAGQRALQQGASMAPLAPLFEGAAARAEAAGLMASAARARFFLGVFAVARRDAQIAGRSLMAAAELARRGDAPILRAQSLRMAGELALEAGLKPRALELLGEARRAARETREERSP